MRLPLCSVPAEAGELASETQPAKGKGEMSEPQIRALIFALADRVASQAAIIEALGDKLATVAAHLANLAEKQK